MKVHAAFSVVQNMLTKGRIGVVESNGVVGRTQRSSKLVVFNV